MTELKLDQLMNIAGGGGPCGRDKGGNDDKCGGKKPDSSKKS